MGHLFFTTGFFVFKLVIINFAFIACFFKEIIMKIQYINKGMFNLKIFKNCLGNLDECQVFFVLMK